MVIIFECHHRSMEFLRILMRFKQSGSEILINARTGLLNKIPRWNISTDISSILEVIQTLISFHKYFRKTPQLFSPPVHAWIVHCDQRRVRNIRCGTFKVSWLRGIRMLNFRCDSDHLSPRRISYVEPKVSRIFAFARIPSEICRSLYIECKIYGDWYCRLIT